jgi:hypothetical protein
MKRNALKFGIWSATFGLGICLLSGCAWSIGGHRDPWPTTVDHVQPTRGQELIDLKKARDQGAVTEDEYQAQKKRLLGP